MKRQKKIQGEQLANATRHEVFGELLPEAPHDARLNRVTLSCSER